MKAAAAYLSSLINCLHSIDLFKCKWSGRSYWHHSLDICGPSFCQGETETMTIGRRGTILINYQLLHSINYFCVHGIISHFVYFFYIQPATFCFPWDLQHVQHHSSTFFECFDILHPNHFWSNPKCDANM